MIEVRILGTIEVATGSGTMPITSADVRRLLVRLALGGATGVDRGLLADDLELSAGALRTAISRLRARLGCRVASSSSRYVLSDIAVDAERFEVLAAATSLEPSQRIAQLQQALALWRGPVLEGVDHEPWAQPTATRLNEMRASTRERLARELLGVGWHIEALAEGRAMATDYPFRDGPRAVVMEALAADGRRTEALRVFQEYRRYLMDEVGTEPGSALSSLDQTIAAAEERPNVRKVHAQLPKPATSLVGRDTDIAEVIDCLRRSSIVTLTGVGGIGKTRLAIRVGEQLVDDYPDGLWFIDLQVVAEPTVLPAAIQSQLGLVAQSGRSVTDSVVDAFSGRRALLILDNCEHVLDAAADWAAEFTERTSSAQLLATSREALHVEGELAYVVGPLEVEGDEHAPAVRLLVDRARAIDPRFSLGVGQLEIAREVCTRLDGVALAIELAAARLSSMGLVDIRDRLDDRFRLLAVSRRGVERHQTLRHAVQWSYELLNANERDVLQRCTVFAGGFDLDAALHLADDDLSEFDVIDALNSLVQKSLLKSDRPQGRARFSMLETIRLFAAEQLQMSGIAFDVYGRFCEYFADQSRQQFQGWLSPRQRQAVEWFRLEFNNMRSAYRSALSLGRLEDATTIAVRAVVVATLSYSAEPVDWCAELLRTEGTTELDELHLLYAGASHCSLLGSDLDAAVVLGRHCLELALATDRMDAHTCAALVGLQVGLVFLGRVEEYLELNHRFAQLEADVLLQFRVSEVFALAILKRFDEARALSDEIVPVALRLDVPSTKGLAEYGRGLAYASSDPDRALGALRRAFETASSGGSTMYEGVILRELARLEAAHGSPEVALAFFERILDDFDVIGQRSNLTLSVGYLAMLFARLGRRAHAAQLLAAAMTDEKTLAMMTGLGDFDIREIDGILNDPELADHVHAGQATGPSKVLAVARLELRRLLEDLSVLEESAGRSR
jgi:predicted ATPase/DNA-binding SARP family transcriptional activator